MHILNFKAPIKKKVSENRCILWMIDWVDLCIHVPAKYKYQHNLGLTTGGCTSPIGLTWKSYLLQQLFVLNPIWNEYNVNMVFSLIVYKASPKGTLEGLTAGSFLILRGNSFTCFWITTLYGIFRCEGVYCFTSGNQSIPWHA